MDFSPAASIPICPPRHGPQVGVETAAPASIKVVIYPFSIASRYTFWVPGNIITLTPSATFLPFIISATTSRSDILPFVQEPITTWSIFISLSISSTVLVFSGRWGKATVSFSSAKSISYTSS